MHWRGLRARHGEPVKIVELARDLIRLSGHKESEIGIVFSGLRPGEKLYEELLADNDASLSSLHPRLRIARIGSLPLFGPLGEFLEALSAPASLDHTTLRARLGTFVHEYMPGGEAAAKLAATNAERRARAAS